MCQLGPMLGPSEQCTLVLSLYVWSTYTIRKIIMVHNIGDSIRLPDSSVTFFSKICSRETIDGGKFIEKFRWTNSNSFYFLLV